MKCLICGKVIKNLLKSPLGVGTIEYECENKYMMRDGILFMIAKLITPDNGGNEAWVWSKIPQGTLLVEMEL